MSDEDNRESKLHQVLKLAAEKEIPYTPTQVKKMKAEELDQVLRDYKAKELDELNEMITDVVIIKFDELLKAYSWVKEDSKLASRLQDKRLFKRDLKNMVSYFTPILPWIGLLEGSVVIASEIIDKYGENKPSKQDEQDDPSETQEGDQQDTS